MSIDIPCDIIAGARNNDIESVHGCIEDGANVNSVDEYGLTPLHAVLFDRTNSDINIVKLLVHHGADVNAQTDYGSTPLILAAENCLLDIVKFLLSNGADPNMQDYNGNTALIYARNFPSVVKTLLIYGADPHIYNNNDDSIFEMVFSGPTVKLLNAYNNTDRIVNEVPDGTVCAICDNEDNPDLFVKTKCGHYFHRFCISSWPSSCPLCRQTDFMFGTKRFSRRKKTRRFGKKSVKKSKKRSMKGSRKSPRKIAKKSLRKRR
jgi:hypothetical protein